MVIVFGFRIPCFDKEPSCYHAKAGKKLLQPYVCVGIFGIIE